METVKKIVISEKLRRHTASRELMLGETDKKIIFFPTGPSISLQAMVFLCHGAGGVLFLTVFNDYVPFP